MRMYVLCSVDAVLQLYKWTKQKEREWTQINTKHLINQWISWSSSLSLWIGLFLKTTTPIRVYLLVIIICLRCLNKHIIRFSYSGSLTRVSFPYNPLTTPMLICIHRWHFISSVDIARKIWSKQQVIIRSDYMHSENSTERGEKRNIFNENCVEMIVG